MLSNYKSFSQNSTETVDALTYGDSLVCFPQRYLQFMVDDIKQGKKDKVKVEELREAVNKKEEDYRLTKTKLSLEMEASTTLRDSLEMKNALIDNIRMQQRRTRTNLTIWQAAAVVLTILFAVK